MLYEGYKNIKALKEDIDFGAGCRLAFEHFILKRIKDIDYNSWAAYKLMKKEYGMMIWWYDHIDIIIDKLKTKKNMWKF